MAVAARFPGRAGTSVTVWVVLVVLLFALTDPWHGQMLVTPLLFMSPLVLLRRAPLTVLAMLIVGLVLTVLLSPRPTVWLTQVAAVELALGYVSATRSRRASAPAAIGVLLVLGVCSYAPTVHTTYDLTSPVDPRALALLLSTVIAWGTGQSVLQRRTYAETLQQQATVQAVIAERLRIARELHDVVAHSIGVIAIQAGTGSRVIDTQPAESANALRAIEEISRDTLTSLRRTLVSLRSADPDDTAGSLDPAPGLADLGTLLTRTGGAGVEVTLTRGAVPSLLPPEVDLAAYRIVQEALTNVVRHAGIDQCEVSLDTQESLLLLEIADRGRGCSTQEHSGYGLVGMRERVALLRGELEAGPRPGGGFRVLARLPLAESS